MKKTTDPKTATVSKLSEACDRIMLFSICAIFYFIPISIALTESFFGFAIAAYIVKKIFLFKSALKNASSSKIKLFFSTFAPVPNYLNKPLGIFILAALLSVIFSYDHSLSIRGFVGKLLQDVYLFFIFVEVFNSKKRLKIFLGVLFVTVGLLSVDGLFQSTMGHDFILNYPLEAQRVNASFRHPNDFGAFLVFVCPLLFSFICHAFKFLPLPKKIKEIQDPFIDKIKFVSIGLFILALINLGLTYSRGAWLAFFITFFILSFSRPRWLSLQILIVLLFYLVFSNGLEIQRKMGLFVDQTDHIQQRIEDLAEKNVRNYPDSGHSQGFYFPGENEIKNYFGYVREKLSFFTGSGRRMYWTSAMMLIKQHPIVGSGINTYSIVAKESKIDWGGYPHNCFLQLTAEMGFLGLAAFLYFLLTLIFKSFVLNSSIQDLFLKIMAWGAFSGFLAFIFHSFVDTNFYSIQLSSLMWISIGLIVAAQRSDSLLRGIK